MQNTNTKENVETSPKNHIEVNVEEKSDSNIDGGFAWIILLAVFLVDCLSRPLQKCLGVLFNELKNELNVSNTIMTIIPGIMGGLTSFVAPFSTYLCSRYGSRPMIILGGFLMSFGLCCTFFTRQASAVVLIISILPGIGQSFISYPNIIILTQYFKKRLTTANGLRLTGNSVGSILFTLTLPLILDHYDVFGTVLIMGGLMLNIIAFGIFYRPKSNPKKIENNSTPSTSSVETNESNKVIPSKITNTNIEEKKNKNEPMEIQEQYTYFGFDEYFYKEPFQSNNEFNPSDSKVNIIEEDDQMFYCCGVYPCDCSGSSMNYSILNSFLYWISVVSIVFVYLQYGCVVVILPAHSQNLNHGLNNSSLILTILSITELISKLMAGPVIDFLKLPRRYCLMIGMTLSTAALSIVFFIDEFEFLLSIGAIYGFLFGLNTTLLIPILSELYGSKNMPSVIGFSGPLNGVAAIVTPFILGMFADTFGSFREAFLLVASLSGFAFICEFYLEFRLKHKR